MNIAQKAAVLLGIDHETNSTMLDMLAEMVTAEVQAYCNITEIPIALDYTQAQMIAFKYNSRHGAGLTGASYSGIREDYRDKYTDDIYASLNRYRKVKLI